MKKLFGIILSFTFLLACSEEAINERTPLDLRLLISVSVKDNNTKKVESSFQNKDSMGIFVVDYVEIGTPLISPAINIFNVPHFYIDGEWNTRQGEELYWGSDNTKSVIYAYYPFDPKMGMVLGKLNLLEYSFDVHTDQSVSDAYESSDFLWAKKENVTPTNTPVEITFEHKMSKIIIDIQNKPDRILSNMHLVAFKTRSYLNINTGQVTSYGNPSFIVPFKYSDVGRTLYKAVIPPQKILKGQAFFLVDVNNVVYVTYSSSDFEFLPGKEYKFNVTLGI